MIVGCIGFAPHGGSPFPLPWFSLPESGETCSMAACVKENELREVLECVQVALAVFQNHEGQLTVSEIRTRSLLMVVRAEAEEQLRRARSLTTET